MKRGKKMKKSIFAKIGAAAVVLTLVTSSLVGGTFAKYTSSVTATGSVTAAAWKIAFKEGDNNNLSESKKFTLEDENLNIGAATDKIAPGSYGTIKVSVDGAGSEVGYSYTITADISGLKGVPLEFHLDDKDGEKLTAVENKITIGSGDVEQANVGTAVTKTIYWVWNDTDGDTSIQGEVGEIGLTLTADQYVKTDVTPAS